MSRIEVASQAEADVEIGVVQQSAHQGLAGQDRDSLRELKLKPKERLSVTQRVRPITSRIVSRPAHPTPAVTGRGIGTQLYQALLDALREKSIHVVIGGIALPNAACVALHERLGFAKVAQFKEVGYKFGQWIDVGYWQILLKNSATVKLPARPVLFDAMRLRCCEAFGHCRDDQLGELAKVLGGGCE